MKFDTLDAMMRAYESARDPDLLPDTFVVARIDGRSFTRLTKELMDLERPFDVKIRDAMVAAVEHLMNGGFEALYGYTQSDEISLLFGRNADVFGRNIRKWTSILAGEASAAFSVHIGRPAAFDCRLIEFGEAQRVVDYFRWRQEDARRNALSAWCYWTLRAEGVSVNATTNQLRGLFLDERKSILKSRGISFDSLPAWQRHGIGLARQIHEKPAINRKTGQPVTARRRILTTDLELPTGPEYGRYIETLLAK